MRQAADADAVADVDAAVSDSWCRRPQAVESTKGKLTVVFVWNDCGDDVKVVKDNGLP